MNLHIRSIDKTIFKIQFHARDNWTACTSEQSYEPQPGKNDHDIIT